MAYARVEKAILSIFEELAGDLVCEEAYSALKDEYNARMDPDIDEDNLVGNYLYNLEKEDGTDYEPDTLTSYHRGIERYLKEKNYPCNILTDKEFESSRSVLAARRNELKSKGLGNRPNKSETLTPQQIDSMWERGVLGSESPRTLQNSVFFLFSKGFGFRGCHESKQLEWGDISLHEDETGTEYVQFSERESKTRHGEAGSAPRAFPPKIFATGDERCPVHLFKMFTDHRPEAMNIPGAPFYLTVKATAAPSDRVWYACCPMGKNTLQKILSSMTKACGFVGRFTNHSVRKTCCQELLNSNVAPTTICQLTGRWCTRSLLSEPP